MSKDILLIERYIHNFITKTYAIFLFLTKKLVMSHKFILKLSFKNF